MVKERVKDFGLFQNTKTCIEPTTKRNYLFLARSREEKGKSCSNQLNSEIISTINERRSAGRFVDINSKKFIFNVTKTSCGSDWESKKSPQITFCSQYCHRWSLGQTLDVVPSEASLHQKNPRARPTSKVIHDRQINLVVPGYVAGFSKIQVLDKNFQQHLQTITRNCSDDGTITKEEDSSPN